MNELAKIQAENAALPMSYQAVVTALSECDRVDECKDWADKAEALKSYARQAGDPRLMNFAMRIQGRAVRRAGELLNMISSQRGGDRKSEQYQNDGGGTLISRTEAARDAGMSERQQVTATRVANVPAAEFERQIESETPPTITKLADMGRIPRQQPAEPPKPPGFAAATNFMNLAEKLASFCAENDPAVIAPAILEHEKAQLHSDLSTINAWTQRLTAKLEGSENV